jgi:hypothetical protein
MAGTNVERALGATERERGLARLGKTATLGWDKGVK